MGAHTFREATESNEPAEFDQLALLRSVASLRDEMQAMASDVRAVLRDNAALRQEVDGLRERAPASARPAEERRGASETLRFRQELHEQLERLRRVAASPRSRPQPVERREAPSSHGAADPAWLKRMMMFAMMSELM